MVSIIIPVYNLENYISICLESVIASDYKDIEIIVVDDGSTDNSGAICDEYAEKQSCMTVIHCDNKGVSAARNTGIENAKGEYIFFLDGDDIIYSGTISYLVSLMNDEMIYSSCGYEVISRLDEKPNNKPGDMRIKSSKTELIDLLNGAIRCGVWGIIFRRDKIGDLKFVEGKIDNEDKFFRFQYLLKNDGKIAETTKPLYGHYDRMGSLSNSPFNERVYKSVLYFSERIKKEALADDDLKESASYNDMVTLLHVMKYLIRKRAYSTRKNDYIKIKSQLRAYSNEKKDFFKNHYVEYKIALMSDRLFRMAVRIHDRLYGMKTVY